MHTRKDYEKAASIARQWKKHSPEVHGEIVGAFVEFFRGDNPRFDADRFREAAGK